MATAAGLENEPLLPWGFGLRWEEPCGAWCGPVWEEPVLVREGPGPWTVGVEEEEEALEREREGR